MKRQRLVSTVLRSAGYERATETLELEFVEGGVYRYFHVPRSVHAELLAAPSHGAYFQAHVRDVYRHERVG